MSTVIIHAANLLKDSAAFFTNLAKDNRLIRKQMTENASVHQHFANEIIKAPEATSYIKHVVNLLIDCASFFNKLAKENKVIKVQMYNNADIFKNIASLVEKDPQQELGEKHAKFDLSLRSPFVYINSKLHQRLYARPIRLGISSPSSNENEFWVSSKHFNLSPTYKQAIFKRDFHTCQFCGFHSHKYQEVIVRNATEWLMDSVFTACIFCSQCMLLENVSNMRSGVLIWAPKISQIDLNVILKIIYVCRISQGPNADLSRSLLDKLMESRAEAGDIIKQACNLSKDDSRDPSDPNVLAYSLRNCENNKDYNQLRSQIQDIRLLSLDRRIIKEADLEFNQFPQILAYWRSKAGPFGGLSPNQMDLSSFEDILQSMSFNG